MEYKTVKLKLEKRLASSISKEYIETLPIKKPTKEVLAYIDALKKGRKKLRKLGIKFD